MRWMLVFPAVGLICAGVSFGAETAERATMSRFLTRIPLSFERNAGQAVYNSAGWIGHADGYRVLLSATGATIVPEAPGRTDAVRMLLADGRPDARAKALEPLPGKTSYLIGRDPKRWIRDLETYGRVEYREVYPGVDVTWYGNQGQLEYDFLLKPGADPSRIRVRFEGVQKLALEAGGDVRVETAAGPMTLRVPEVYQEIAGTRRRVAGRYVLRTAHEIAFDLAGYDKSRPLVVDPTLVYGTYFGGGLNVISMATDSSGNVYIAGLTQTGLPPVNALQPAMLGANDIWLAKFNPAGTSLIYSTYVGGSGGENTLSSQSLAATSAGELIATGLTFSVDFPLFKPVQSQGPVNPALYCLPFAFKLNANGNGFVYSTYLGGNPPDGAAGWAVAIDSAGNAYIAGETDGTFATTPGVYQSVYGGGWSDAFVVKLDPTGALLYSTMLGGAGLDYAVALKVDSVGNAYLAGLTSSTAFPSHPPGAVTTNAGLLDTFVAKLSPDASTVNWLTFLGGTGDDIPAALARDAASGQVYVAGHTNSVDLPTTAGVIQPAAHGPQQGFVASVNPGGMSFGFVTYLGGGKEDVIRALALTSSGLVVGGSASSPSLPISNAIQPAFAGGTPSFFASTNYGASWKAADTGLPASVIGVAPDPSVPGAVLAASGDDFEWFRSTNRGASWTRTALASGFLWWHSTAAQVVRAAASPSVLYITYPFGGGLNDSSVLNPHNNNFLAFGSNDNGATWRHLASPVPDASDILAGIAVSPMDPNEIVEISTAGRVFQSTDGGAHFTQVSIVGGPSWGYPQAVAGSPDGSIYVGACNFFKSPDFGSTWTVGQWIGFCVGNIAVSPSNPQVVYAGSAWNDPLLLYRSRDAGATWTQVTSPSVGGPLGSVLVVAPSNPNVVYAASGKQVTVSKDGGATWSSAVSLPSNIWTIAVSPQNPAVVYAGTYSVSDGFAAKLSTDGRTLPWSTFYSGGSGASVNAVAGAGSGAVWIAGGASAGLPITHNAYSLNAYGGTAFLARVSDATAACAYSLGAGSVLAYGAATTSVTVTAPSGCTWTATPSGSWIKISSGSSGAGSGIVSAALAANQTGATRAGSISVGGKTFAIKQAASSCTYSLSGDVNVPASGGTVEIAVTAPARCSWNTIPGSPFVSIVSGGSGSGNGAVTLALPANEGVQWLTPTAQIGSQTVALQQANACDYTLSPQSLDAAAGSGSMTVTAKLPGCSWSPQSDSPWLSVSGSGKGSGTFLYSITENDTGASRTANVTLDHQVFPVTQTP